MMRAFLVRIDPGLHARAKALGAKLKVSLATVVRLALAEFLERHEK